MKSIFVWSVSVVTILILAVSACNRKKTEAEPVAASKSAPVLVQRGAPAGAATSATIGTAGGALKSSDGRLAMSIPPGALTLDTAISIQPVSDVEGIAVGPVYELSPEGTTFAQPVMLSWQFNDAEMAGRPITDLVIATRDSEGGWNRQRGIQRDAAAKTVQVAAPHFSVWTATWVDKLPSLHITPEESTVMVSGSVNLKALIDEDWDLLTAPVKKWQSDPTTAPTPPAPTPAPGPKPGGTGPGSSDDDLLTAPPTCVKWSVNGSVGGDKDHGKISGDGDSAVFVAPAKVPTPKQVTVSCVAPRGRAKVVAVAYVTIKDKATGWHGNIEYTYSESHQTNTPNGAGGAVTNFATTSRTATGQFDLTADNMGWGTVSGTGNGNGKVVETYGMRNPICAMDGGSTISGDLKVEAGGHAGSGAGDLTVTAHGDALSMEQHKSDNCSKQSKPYHDESSAPWGVTCQLVGIDFSKGGTYEAPVPADNGHGSCKLTISPQ